jgi:hypothetical protein
MIRKRRGWRRRPLKDRREGKEREGKEKGVVVRGR